MSPILINIIVGLLVVILSLVLGIKLLLRKSNEIKIFGAAWVVASITFFTNILPDILIKYNLFSEEKYVSIFTINQFLIVLFGMFLYYYIFIILFGKKKKLYWFLLVPVVLAVIYLYYVITGIWGEEIYTDWGTDIVPPLKAQLFFFAFSLVGIVIVLYIATRELVRKAKGHIFRFDRFIACVAVLIFAVFGSIDETGYFSGWQLVLVRMLTFVGVLVAYFAYQKHKMMPSFSDNGKTVDKNSMIE